VTALRIRRNFPILYPEAKPDYPCNVNRTLIAVE